MKYGMRKMQSEMQAIFGSESSQDGSKSLTFTAVSELQYSSDHIHVINCSMLAHSIIRLWINDENC